MKPDIRNLALVVEKPQKSAVKDDDPNRMRTFDRRIKKFYRRKLFLGLFQKD